MAATTVAAPEVIGKCRNGHSVQAMWDDVRAGWIFCQCGAAAIAKGFRATVSEKTCDGRCTSAMGPSCSCECGGRNHGADRRF